MGVRIFIILSSLFFKNVKEICCSGPLFAHLKFSKTFAFFGYVLCISSDAFSS